MLSQPLVLSGPVHEADVHAYLFYDYVPRLNPQAPFWILRDWDGGRGAKSLAKSSHPSLIEQGVKTLRECMRATLEESGRSKAVISLSGGVDSRAILGGLLENLNSSEIQAATFGVPGAADFDIARRVTKEVGLRHELFDARSIPWTTEALLRFVRQRGAGLLPAVVGGPYYGHVIRSRFGTGPAYWDGFLGDSVGESMSLSPAANWQEAVARFIRFNRATVGRPLTPPGYRPEDLLPAKPICDERIIDLEDQLNFAIRQPYRIFTRINPRGGDQNALPFRHGSWVNFILNVPIKYRRGGVLFTEILHTAYPKLFAMPTTRGLEAGVRVRLSRLMAKINRRLPSRVRLPARGLVVREDFPNFIRRQRDLKLTICENLEDLRQRHIVDWIDVHHLWEQHLAGARDYSSELRTLVSLEINLKAAETARSSEPQDSNG